ncbi:hypothetical protein HAX54_044495 [Datura stramonium]|uniref:Secreted protein n=1 Tax=Datura stramonium TaxID=4076 RepID=A0ABS8SPN2_DATST|nr:hypothetical protein [Datura stramonium]
MKKLKFARRWHWHAQGSSTLALGQARHNSIPCTAACATPQESKRYSMREAALSQRYESRAAAPSPT